MMFSVAMNQPQFAPDDDGGLGFAFASLIAPAITALIDVGGQFASAKITSGAIKDQIAAQTQATKDLAIFQANQQKALMEAQAKLQADTPITAQPYFLPVIGIVGAVMVYFMMTGK